MGRNERARSVLSGRRRLIAAIAAAALIGLPAAGLLLTPDRRGHGTHEQLGLPPCTMMVLFGVRCPTCGATTAVAHVARGELIEAFRANAAGALLALLSVPAGVWVCLSAIRGRWLFAVPNAAAVAAIALGLLVIAIADWILRLCIMVRIQ